MNRKRNFDVKYYVTEYLKVKRKQDINKRDVMDYFRYGNKYSFTLNQIADIIIFIQTNHNIIIK